MLGKETASLGVRGIAQERPSGTRTIGGKTAFQNVTIENGQRQAFSLGGVGYGEKRLETATRTRILLEAKPERRVQSH